jgi:predicted lactoylglutathione lyase
MARRHARSSGSGRAARRRAARISPSPHRIAQPVDAFHRAALAAGGNNNGAPGLRPQYHANYYGAFVLDPDGNNIEAVCHAATQSGAL